MHDVCDVILSASTTLARNVAPSPRDIACQVVAELANVADEKAVRMLRHEGVFRVVMLLRALPAEVLRSQRPWHAEIKVFIISKILSNAPGRLYIVVSKPCCHGRPPEHPSRGCNGLFLALPHSHVANCVLVAAYFRFAGVPPHQRATMITSDD